MTEHSPLNGQGGTRLLTKSSQMLWNRELYVRKTRTWFTEVGYFLSRLQYVRRLEWQARLVGHCGNLPILGRKRCSRIFNTANETRSFLLRRLFSAWIAYACLRHLRRFTEFSTFVVLASPLWRLGKDGTSEASADSPRNTSWYLRSTFYLPLFFSVLGIYLQHIRDQQAIWDRCALDRFQIAIRGICRKVTTHKL